jgi:hypothetical protein
MEIPPLQHIQTDRKSGIPHFSAAKLDVGRGARNASPRRLIFNFSVTTTPASRHLYPTRPIHTLYLIGYEHIVHAVTTPMRHQGVRRIFLPAQRGPSSPGEFTAWLTCQCIMCASAFRSLSQVHRSSARKNLLSDDRSLSLSMCRRR